MNKAISRIIIEIFQDIENCSLQSKRKKIHFTSISILVNKKFESCPRYHEESQEAIQRAYSARRFELFIRREVGSRRNRIVERYFRHLSPPETFSRDGIRCSNRAVSRWFLRFGTAEPTSALLGHNRRRCIDFSFIRCCCCCSHGALPLHRDRVDTCQLSFPSLSSLYSPYSLFIFFSFLKEI